MPERIHYLVTATEQALRTLLISLPRREMAYITADQYEQITGEALDEFSTEGRLMLRQIAMECRCDVRDQQGQVVFSKT